MKLIDGKSVLLGIGIGIIITSILGFIFFLGYRPQLSDAEIISRAKELGMVDKLEIAENIRRNPDGSVTLVIVEGESYEHVAERLHDAGIIDNPVEFEIMIRKANLQDAIKPGEYQLYYGDDTTTIVEMITGRNQ